MVFKTLLLLLVVTFGPSYGLSDELPATNNELAVIFTPEEKQWINNHPTIDVAVRHGWAPVEFLNESNKLIGLSVNFLEKIEKLSGLTFQLMQAHADGASSETADVIASVPSIKAFENTRFKPLDSPYISIPYAIFINNKKNKEKINILQDLAGKKVAVFKTGKVIDFLEKSHPEIVLVKVDIATEALEALTLNKVDAYIGNMMVISYNAKNEGFGNIILAAEIPQKASIHMGVRDDWPILNAILTKSLSAITQQQKNALTENWSGVIDERGFVYDKLLKGVLALLIFSIVISLWNWRLKSEVRRRKLVEQQLSLLNTSIKYINDIVVITDAEPNNQRIIFVNDAFEQKTGYSREEAIGQKPSLLQGPKTNHKDLGLIREALRQWQPIQLELINYTKSGKEIWLDLDITPITNEDGTVMNWVSVEREISDRKAIETELLESKKQAEAANVAKSEFLANMSHEIRTPMNAVLGMTTMLRDTKLDDAQLDFLNTINDASISLLDIINNVLDSSKIEAGKLDIEASGFSLRNVADSCIDMFAATAQKTGIHLIYYLDPEIKHFVISDSVRVRQIFVNLLSNAIKFTDKGYVSLHINLESEHNGTYNVSIKVEDSGIGMDNEALDMIYQPFSQSDSSISRRFGGTGLGLTIIKKLIELMHGNITVESQIDVGSIFTVQLPFKKGNVENQLGKPSWLHGKNVLVLDEIELRANVVKQYLQDIGISVSILSHGDEPSLKYHEYDLVFISASFINAHTKLVKKILSQCQSNVKKLILSSENAEKAINTIKPNLVLAQPIKQSRLYEALINIFDRRGKNTTVKHDRRSAVSHPLNHAVNQYEGTVLIVDDNPLNLKVAAALLEKLGLVAQTALSGREALDKIAIEEFALIFMDCQMPGLDGFEVTKRIRQETLSTNRYKPVVALTASAMEGDRERCLTAGMDAHLSKPIDMRRLAEVVAKYLPMSRKSTAKANLVHNKQEQQSNENDQVLNASKLEEMFQDDESTISYLLQQFLVDMPEMLEKLNHHVQEGDFEKVAADCHKVIGSSSSYGFYEFSETCSKLASAAKQHDHIAVNTRFNNLTEAFERVSEYIQKRQM